MKKSIRIKLKSYDYRILDKSCLEIVEVAKKTGANISGPVPLPTKRKLYTVNRSPHVDKKSREQFESCIHSRLIDIKDATPETIEALTRLDLPAGVEVEIKS